MGAKLLPGPGCCVQDWHKLVCVPRTALDEACGSTLQPQCEMKKAHRCLVLSAAQQAGLWTGAGGRVEGSQWVCRAQVRACCITMVDLLGSSHAVWPGSGCCSVSGVMSCRAQVRGPLLLHFGSSRLSPAGMTKPTSW